MWYTPPMRQSPDQFMSSLAFQECYRVGGSVRDELLGRAAKDSDYMVRGATLTEICGALTKTGAKVTALKLIKGRGQGGVQIGWRAKVKGIGLLEIVMPRTDVPIGFSAEEEFGPRSRHDFNIVIDKNLNLADDAMRRDFTVNALYKDVKTGTIIDPLERGISDLSAKQLRTTHPKSFVDDPLRILRALRFMSTRGLVLSEDTFVQMFDHAAAVTGLTQKGVSGTALEELCKLLMGSNPGQALDQMAEAGVMEVFLPELAPMIDFEQRSRYHEKTTSAHTFAAVQAAANMATHAPLRVRMALLFHDCGKPEMAWTDHKGLQHYYALSEDQIFEYGASVRSMRDHEDVSADLAGVALKRLNAPKDLRRDVVTLIERHMLPLHENIRPFKIRKLRSELGDELLRDLITHRLCDVIGKGGDTTEAVEVLTWIANEQERAIASNVPVKVTDLELSGGELAEMEFHGRAIGAMQRQLLHEVLAQPDLNNNAWLAKRAVSLRQ